MIVIVFQGGDDGRGYRNIYKFKKAKTWGVENKSNLDTGIIHAAHNRHTGYCTPEPERAPVSVWICMAVTHYYNRYK
jgi:hypothetical protein